MNLGFFINFDFFSECVFLQTTLMLLLLFFVNCNNNYYNLLYLFLMILLIGSVLCFLNNELTAGFLWVGEILVVFVFLLLILYININADSKKIFIKNNIFLFPIFFFFIMFWEHDNTYSEDDLLFLYCDLYWVDYYEALNDFNNNDLFGFFISYYILNNIILMIFGLILFIGSIICVLLFRAIKVVKFNNTGSFFNVLKFSQNFLYNMFFRKQDLFDQNSFFSSLKTIYSKND